MSPPRSAGSSSASATTSRRTDPLPHANTHVMDTTMELDELKQAWQTLGRQLERQDAMQFQLLRDRKLEHARRSLRPLFWGQLLQMLLGLGLVLLGVACWSRNTDAPALLWTGIAVHAFGVAHIALAGITIGLIGTIDYAAPVLKIQKQA